MRHNISVVNHSISFWDVFGDIAGEVLISYPGFSISVKLVTVPEEVVDVEAGNGGES